MKRLPRALHLTTPVAVFVAAMLLIAAVAYTHYAKYEQEEIRERQRYLLKLAQLKSNQVEARLRSKKSAAEVSGRDAHFADSVTFRVGESFLHSASQEILVVRRDGDSIVFLNELRIFDDTTAHFRLPAGDPTLVAAQAVRGVRGMTEGTDYSGARVIAAVTEVAGTDWLVIAKLDRAEISTPLRRHALETWAATLLLIALTGAIVCGWWRKREAMLLLRQKRAELEARTSAERCDFFMKHANDAIFLLDDAFRVVEANERALLMYGYTHEELVGQHAFIVRAEGNVSVERVWQGLEQTGGMVYEVLHKRKDGTCFPVEISARLAELNGRTYCHAIIRDVSDRKATERRIDRLTRYYAALSETNNAIIRAADRESLLERVCKVAVEQGDLAVAWVGVPRADSQEVEIVHAIGSAAGLADEVRVSVDAAVPEGNGPVGRAYRLNEVQVCNDFGRDESTAPWHATAARFGVRSAAAFPLRAGGKAYGVLALYAKEIDYFDAELIALLREMAEDLSFGLEMLELETKRRRTERDLAFKTALLETQQETGLDGILVVDNERNISSYNRRFVQMWGIPDEIMASRSEERAMQSVLRKLADPHLFVSQLESVYGRSDVRLQDELALQDGRTFERYVASMHGQDRHHYGTVCYFRDITERKRAAEQAGLSKAAFESMADALMIMSRRKRVVWVNRAFTKITGYEPHEVIGQSARILQSGKQTRAFYRAMRRELTETSHWQGEICDRRKDGELYPALLSVSAVRDGAGRILHYVGLFNDISQAKKYEERLEHLAHHDALTDLPNRVLFKVRAAEALARADRHDQKLALLFIDLDQFKNVNDSLGHAAGDLLLEAVADRLQGALRETDTVARFGGDEFALLLDRVTEEQDVARVAEKILAALAPAFVVAGHDLFVSASLGIACYPRDGADVQTLLRNADAAMYRAKAQGRNAYLFFSAEMNDHAFEHLVLANALRQALARNEFMLHYQPRYNLTTGELNGAEALIRWLHPERGLVPPDKFIPIAEETGLISEIGEWVLRTACCQVQTWRARGLDMPRIAVNLSARQFRDPGLMGRVSAALRECELEPSALELEVTESMMMHDPILAATTLQQLNAMGVLISIDDFGTGYSSLSYLKRFPISYLKIDKSFIKGVPGDGDDVAIVNAVIALAKSLNMRICAEGVETDAQRQFLRTRGCDEAQGYYFSKPVPADQFEKLLERVPDRAAAAA